jgi:hypothetical protein
LGDEIPQDEGGTSLKKYIDYWGYEIDLLVAVSQALNFNYTTLNPPYGILGHVNENGLVLQPKQHLELWT